MKIILLLFIILFHLFISQASAQKGKLGQIENSHAFYLGAGYMVCNNSFSIPAGLPGSSSTFIYQLEKQSARKEKRHFRFTTRFDFANLENKKVTTDLSSPYYYFRLNLRESWEWKLPVYSTKLTTWLGAGSSFEAEYIHPSSMEFGQVMFGNWDVSLDLTSKVEYRFHKLVVTNYFRLPVLVGGFFLKALEFPVLLEDVPRYLVTPNTLACIGNYFQVDNHLSLSYPFKKYSLSFSYLFAYNQYYLHKNSQTDLQHSFAVGIIF